MSRSSIATLEFLRCKKPWRFYTGLVFTPQSALKGWGADFSIGREETPWFWSGCCRFFVVFFPHPPPRLSPFFMSEVSEFFDNRFNGNDLATSCLPWRCCPHRFLCWTVTAPHPSHLSSSMPGSECSGTVQKSQGDLGCAAKLGVFSCVFSIFFTGAVEADKVYNRMAMSKVVVAACYLPKVFSFHKDTKKHKQLHDIPNYFSSKGMNQMRYLAHTLDVSELPHNHRLDVKKDQTNVVNSGRFQLPTSFNWCSW